MSASFTETAQVEPCWAIVELMGHVKLAGRISEEEKFGTKMGRIDIPDGDGFTTQFFSGSSVYRITPVSEDVARHVSRVTSSAPVSPWDFPKRLGSVPALTPSTGTDEDEDDEDEDDDGDEFIDRA